MIGYDRYLVHLLAVMTSEWQLHVIMQPIIMLTDIDGLVY